MERLAGTGVALVTPFDEHLQIDEESLARLVNHVIDGGVDFLVALGTTAESATLSEEEKARVVSIIVRENRKRLPVVVGVGGNNTAEIVRKLEHTAWLSECQAILSVVPFYNKPTQEGIYEHFRAIAAASPLPVCLYNIPGRTGVNMNASTVGRLLQDCPNIAGLKEASGNMSQATDVLKVKRPGFTVLSGDDAIILPLMAMGFDGVISVMANVLPRVCSGLVNLIVREEYADARRWHLALSDLCKALFQEGNPAGIKAALSAAGIIKHNTLRLPLTPVGEELHRRIEELLVDISRM